MNKIRIEERFTVTGDKSPYSVDCTRDDLAVLFGELGYTVGAEIGVHFGHYSKVLFDNVPNLKLYCVDPWGYYKTEKVITPKLIMNRYVYAVVFLSQFNSELMRMTSEEAAKIVPDGYLDFVYIDALHDYDSVKQDIKLWLPKIRNGGYIGGHDYGYPPLPDVKKAVDEIFGVPQIIDTEYSWMIKI